MKLELEYIDADSLFDGKYERPLYDKFVEAYEIDDLEVFTPNGWINIEGIGKTIEFEEWRIFTSDGKELICADKHILYRCDNIDFITKKCDLTEIFCEKLQLGDFIMTANGPDMIMEFGKTGEKSHMYDLQLSEGSNKQYYTNDILSHNSLWMQNYAVNVANLGYNVLYVTLEMTEKKVLKRMGSMRLKIPIDNYDELSKDKELIDKKIKALKRSNSDDVFENKVGKIYTKFWAAGTIGIAEIDNYMQKLKDKKGIKIDFLIVDYLSLLVAPKGMQDNLYIKGKSLSEGLRSLGAKWKCPVLTAMQLAKDAWNASDISLASVPESKAIVECADLVMAIIRSEEMKRDNKYRIKLLKQRDGGFSKSQAKFDLNPVYLTIENEMFLDFA